MRIPSFINRQYIGSALLPFSILCFSAKSMALIDVEAQIGVRNATWKQDSSSSKSTSSQVFRAAGHLDPIPLVPVSFGLGLYSETWKVNETDHGLTSLSSYSAVPEIQAWLPLGDFKPFGRLGYSILSAYSGKASLGTDPNKVSGTLALAGAGVHAAAGVEWSVPAVPLLSILGSFEYADETLKLAKDKIGDVDVSASFKNLQVKSTAFLIGAKLGF